MRGRLLRYAEANVQRQLSGHSEATEGSSPLICASASGFGGRRATGTASLTMQFLATRLRSLAMTRRDQFETEGSRFKRHEDEPDRVTQTSSERAETKCIMPRPAQTEQDKGFVIEKQPFRSISKRPRTGVSRRVKPHQSASEETAAASRWAERRKATTARPCPAVPATTTTCDDIAGPYRARRIRLQKPPVSVARRWPSGWR
jgi:hypothetical protein